ncbi:MAG: riboflavin synthase [Chloroflexota bacterium]
MFTGIVEEVGQARSFEGSRLSIRAARVTEDLSVSDSICIAGACLTVVAVDDEGFSVDVIPETFGRTNLRSLEPGCGVNLERSLAFGGRIGGHIVQGHVDAVATVREWEEDGDAVTIRLDAPENIMRYMAPKGFVALDGTSLTVVDCDRESFSVALIPYTCEHTTIRERAPGSQVNVEVDITAKYVEQMARPYLERLASAAAGH